jgi:transposase InsO family protein
MKNYHNLRRPHSALGGKTPIEVAGIELELGEQKR